MKLGTGIGMRRRAKGKKKLYMRKICRNMIKDFKMTKKTYTEKKINQTIILSYHTVFKLILCIKDVTKGERSTFLGKCVI